MKYYNLPIYNAQTALTIALPPLAGVAIEITLMINERLAAKGQLQTSRIFQVVMGFFLAFETALATLAGTHISPPGSLTCALRERWQDLFQAKNGHAIKRIQNAFSCCGFNGLQDMAFPFEEDSTHGKDACIVRYERSETCIEPWRMEERKVAIMLLVVPLAVFLWKVKDYHATTSASAMLTLLQVAIILAPSSQSSWLPSGISLPSESDNDSAAQRRKRPAIAYRDVEDAAEEDSLQREVTNLNNDSHLASHVESNRTKAKGRFINEADDVWREERA